MPRGNRHHLPGYVWHITERCHRKQFLLKFARDRRSWVRWPFEARKRFGLCVLNYQVTSNHVHLLVRDRGAGEIERSMQLIASCTGQRTTVANIGAVPSGKTATTRPPSIPTSTWRAVSSTST